MTLRNAKKNVEKSLENIIGNFGRNNRGAMYYD